MSDIAALLAALEPKFREQGYKHRKTQRDFTRRDDRGNFVRILVDLNRPNAKGAKKVYIYLNVRIDELERVYMKHLVEQRPHLSDADRRNHATFARYCDYLFPKDSPLLSSLFLNEETFAAVSELVWQSIADYVFPFAECYSDRNRLAKNLASTDKMERISSDAVVRHVVPMANAALNNDRAGFEEYGEAFFKFCGDYAQTARYRPLAEAVYHGIKQEYFS